MSARRGSLPVLASPRARVALVTRLEQPGLTPDDALAVRPLAERGLDVVAAPWDDPLIDWHGFDLIVPRSCWNYHRRPQRFAALLAAWDDAALRVLNPVSVCRWNMRKTYLLFLRRHGVPVPATFVLRRGGTPDLATIARELGTVDLIVKPVIGAWGWNLFRLHPDDHASTTRLARLLRRRSVLIQPWLPDVAGNGEWSLVFFDGVDHHAVLKHAAAGEIRVHEEFGGSVECAEPPAAVLRAARAAIDTISPLPFARVDVVETKQGPLVMELELIEPELFLRCHPDAPARFAEALSS
jgi:glutathione synthase/RimK-type ligase-like ATP-grasp enzyme